MFRSLSSAPPKRTGRLASALAMSVALAGASLAASAVLPAPAAAQDYSKKFASVYQPVADVVNAEGGDIASVSGQFPAVVAAVETPDDRFAAGNLILIAGNKTENPQLQRQGLELMVASGKTTPEQIGQFQYFIGSLAYQAKDYAAARTALEAAKQANYTGENVDIPGLIAQSYFDEGNAKAGVEYVLKAGAELKASGGQVPEGWLLKALQASYDSQMVAEATQISEMLVSTYPTERNWMNALQVVGALNEFPPAQQLDLFRLMRETNSLTDRSEFVRYIEAADPRIMSNEVNAVLAAGLAKGEFQPDDEYYKEVKSIADLRAPQDQSEAPKLATSAKTSSDPRDAADAADVLYSLGDFAQAEQLYQLALDKGFADKDTVLTRLGIAQAKQGKFADAQATFKQVSGQRAPIAQMWSLYAQTKSAAG